MNAACFQKKLELQWGSQAIGKKSKCSGAWEGPAMRLNRTTGDWKEKVICFLLLHTVYESESISKSKKTSTPKKLIFQSLQNILGDKKKELQLE